jgi:hypothetical protein
LVDIVNRRTFLASAMLPLWSCKKNHTVEGDFLGLSHERGHLFQGKQGKMVSRPVAKNYTAQVLIAGAGIAGLSAARALQRKGIEDFVVVDLEDRVGGNSGSTVINHIPCPTGAHYLPVPGAAAREVQEFLEDIGVRQRVAGRWTIDDKHLCHSPQERLFIDHHWQEGLLPMNGVPQATLDQYYRFQKIIDDERRRSIWSIPVRQTNANHPHLRYLSTLHFKTYLNNNNINDPYLIWFLNYCCLDEYGADIGSVSAWAGIHYFASRHGFNEYSQDDRAETGLLTWPEGNAWLVNHLARPVQDRLHTAQVIMRIEAYKHHVEVDVLDYPSHSVKRWNVKNVIVALPAFVAARVVHHPLPALKELQNRLHYAPWLVANISIEQPLADGEGVELSWDNVVFGSQSLGYVHAAHQNLAQKQGGTVLTHYRALGLKHPQSMQRQWLMKQPWSYWRDAIFSEFSACHPDLAEKTTRIDITRYGHGMAIPTPHDAGKIGYSLRERTQGRLIYAHSDWAGYSIFEEAFTLGNEAGSAL